MQHRAIDWPAPRAVLAQGDTVGFHLQGPRQDGDLSDIGVAPSAIAQEGCVTKHGLHAAAHQSRKQFFWRHTDEVDLSAF